MFLKMIVDTVEYWKMVEYKTIANFTLENQMRRLLIIAVVSNSL